MTTEHLTDELTRPSLYDEALLLLARSGIAVPTRVLARDRSAPHEVDDDVDELLEIPTIARASQPRSEASASCRVSMSCRASRISLVCLAWYSLSRRCGLFTGVASKSILASRPIISATQICCVMRLSDAAKFQGDARCFGSSRGGGALAFECISAGLLHSARHRAGFGDSVTMYVQIE